MKKMPSAARICLFSSIVLTLLGTILRTVAMFVCFDTKVGYFDPSLLSVLLTVLSFAAVLLPTGLALLTPKGILPTAWPEPGRGLPALLPALCCGASGLWTLGTCYSQNASPGLWTLTMVMALASAFYYLIRFSAAFQNRDRAAIINVLGFAPVFWGLFAVAETYMDQFTTMNSPIKLSLQFAFLGVMLVTVSALRFHFEKPLPRCAMCFYAIAAYFCLTGSVPLLISLAAGITDNALHGAYAVLLLGVGVYTMASFISYFIAQPVSPRDKTLQNSESAAETDSQ